jgi:hypothetical protein
MILTRTIGRQKSTLGESKELQPKKQEHEETKATIGREREDLPHRMAPFIGAVKHTYHRTPTVQSASPVRPIH